MKEKNSALIVVDVQNDFCPGGALAVPRGDEVVSIINRLINLDFSLVVVTQDWHPDRHCSFIENGGLWPKHCVAGTIGADLRLDLTLAKRECVLIRKGTELYKDAYSGFEGTGLEKTLNDVGIKRVFVCGLATDYCVKATALDAKKAGFETFVIIDACRGVNVKKGDVARAVKEMRKAGIKIIASKDI